MKLSCLVFLAFSAVSESLQSTCRHHGIAASPTFARSSSVVPSPLFATDETEATAYMRGDTPQQLKLSLLEKVSEFRDALEKNDKDVEFAETKPETVDFYSISKGVGDKAQAIYEICDKMSQCPPISDATKFIGDDKNGFLAPLNGQWHSLFSNNVDANFGRAHSTKAGSGDAQMLVDAPTGKFTNVVDYYKKDTTEKEEPTMKQLSVVLKAMAVNSKRIEFQFKNAKAIFTRLLWFKFQWSLYVPGPMRKLATFVIAMANVVRGILGKKSIRIPKKQEQCMDVLYLDEHVCIHRTGQDNLFVRVRENWNLARPLIS